MFERNFHQLWGAEEKDYLVLKCPRCQSTSEIKTHGISPVILLCPVCLEGEVEHQVGKVGIHHKTTAKSTELVIA